MQAEYLASLYYNLRDYAKSSDFNQKIFASMLKNYTDLYKRHKNIQGEITFLIYKDYSNASTY